MKFSSREDIEAPIDHVYAAVTDFGAYERQALRRGADVRRTDGSGPAVLGSTWDVAFSYRGKDRKLKAKLVRYDDQGLQLDTTSSGIDGQTVIDLVPLSPKRTRLAVSIEMKAKSLPARLLLQSLKLAKASLTTRFKKRVADFASDVESRYKPGT